MQVTNDGKSFLLDSITGKIVKIDKFKGGFDNISLPYPFLLIKNNGKNFLLQEN
jgi:hypothetical protein